MESDPTAVVEESVITPPKDFQDHLADSCAVTCRLMSEVVVSGEQATTPGAAAALETMILEPPAMFCPASTRLRPKTELFWSSERPAPAAPLLLPAKTSQVFSQELERLKSHSLFLRFPLDGAARVHYRSSSVVVQSSSVSQYR